MSILGYDTYVQRFFMITMLFFVFFCSDFASARRHPCGLEFVNLTFMIETLFSYTTLLSLIQDKEPFVSILQKAKISSVELNSVGEMCEFHELYRTHLSCENDERSTVIPTLVFEVPDMRDTDNNINRSKKARRE